MILSLSTPQCVCSEMPVWLWPEVSASSVLHLQPPALPVKEGFKGIMLKIHTYLWLNAIKPLDRWMAAIQPILSQRF